MNIDEKQQILLRMITRLINWADKTGEAEEKFINERGDIFKIRIDKSGETLKSLRNSRTEKI